MKFRTTVDVADVAASFKWYQSLLGLRATTPGHHYFGQILDWMERSCPVSTSGVPTRPRPKTPENGSKPWPAT
jgi:hypothetical protein